MNEIILIGGGGFSAEVAEVAEQNNYKVIGYVDSEKTSSCLKYLGKFSEIITQIDASVYFFPAFGAIDRKTIRSRSQNLSEYAQLNIPSLVSPYAIVSKNVKISKGVFIAHGVILNSEASIGDFSIINSSSVIGHNVTLKKDVVISGNVFLGGACRVGERTLVGPGALILQSLNIGSDVIISIGSVVCKDIPNKKTVIPSVSKVI